MSTNEMQLRAILDKTCNEKMLIDKVQQLQSLCEDRDFWTKIITDVTYSATHRRVAFVQYFIRHAFERKASEMKLDALNLSSSEFSMKLLRMWTGVIPIQVPLDNAVVEIACRFSEVDSARIFLSISPNSSGSELLEILLGRKIDSNQVITDVGAGEQLTCGAYINWKRWQGNQVYEYLS
ncbi:MAG TPA: hypothetical protein VKV04_22205 [Verrucomicrobiae bacterium]|nr:hypothetical protein [Verrucomicrobiae bacterium]